MRPLPALQRAALIFAILLLAFAPSGCVGCADANDTRETQAASDRAAESLRLRFPERAGLVLDTRHALTPVAGGFALDARETRETSEGRPPAHRRLEALLPERGADPVRFDLPGGFSVRVREYGVVGDGLSAGRAVAYAREGGTSYWAATEQGYEEWLLLDAGAAVSDRPAATWQIEGATLRQGESAIEVVDDAGRTRIEVTAPAAFTASGRSIEARLGVKGETLELWVDGGGEPVLVDPAWYAAAPLSTQRYNHTATLLPNGTVLVTGGNFLTTCEIYDPATDLWTPAASMTKQRASHSATLLPNGKVLVLGGRGVNTVSNDGELYDPSTNTWSPVPSPQMIFAVNHTATLLLDGRVLVAGGSSGDNDQSFGFASSAVYDPATNTWTPAGNMAQERRLHAAVRLVDGRVLVTGGRSGLYSALLYTELFNPATLSWSPGPNMVESRQAHTATLLPDGRVLVTGGNLGVNGGKTIDIYNPITNTWSSPFGSNMSGSRERHTATLLWNGQVLVTGGITSNDPTIILASAELFNPATTTWSSASTMTDKRSKHTATRLPSDTVLITGGIDFGVPHKSTELYAPSPSGTPCGGGGECITGFCVEGYCCNTACAGGPCDACSVAAGADVNGTCKPFTGIACNDGDLCTQTDVCQSGVCVGQNPIPCAPAGQCNNPATCNKFTGQCSYTPQPNGTPCDDGNACTTGDTCKAGACVGSPPPACPPADACHLQASCNPATGVCPPNPNKPDGTACNDGSNCTSPDVCQSGVCVGQNPVVCPPPQSQCYAQGTCLPATGMCTTPQKPSGAACNDGNACTQTDVCQNGACVGGNLVACALADQCHGAGTCDPLDGTCANVPNKPDGTACNDGNACTQMDTCQNGVCVGGGPVVCAPPGQCQDSVACAPATGQCVYANTPNGAACSDGNACTQVDTCQGGVCVGASPIVCAAIDQCHSQGACDPQTGACNSPAKGDGTACDDGNACTKADTCQAGACAAGAPVICAAQDECHEAGACDSGTGACTNPVKNDGAPCSKGTCVAGVCVPELDAGADGGSSSSGTGGNGTGGNGGGGNGAGGNGTGGTTTGTGGGATTGTGGGTTTGVGGGTTTGTGGETTTGVGGATTSTGSGVTTGPGTSSASSAGGGQDTPDAGGCGCGVAGAPAVGGLWSGLALVLLARRRGAARRSAHARAPILRDAAGEAHEARARARRW